MSRLCRWAQLLAQVHHSTRVLFSTSSHVYAPKIKPLPPIDDADIEETFVRGSGPGGQSINKTNISVSLIHKPTGIRVQCHQTRSREWNRSLARKILREKVDLALNPGNSKLESKWAIASAKKAAQARKRRRKLEKKEAEKVAELEAKEAQDGSEAASQNAGKDVS